MDGKNLYTEVEKALFEVEERVKSINPKATVGLVVFAGRQYNSDKQSLYIELGVDDYSMNSVKVKGVDIEEMTQELIHRMKFQARQNTKQLGSPIVVQDKNIL